MKKLFILFSLLCASIIGSAQNTTLTGVIQDANAQVFASGTCTIQFVPLPGNAGPYTINGAAFNTQPLCTLDGSGVIGGTVTDNLLIKPAGSKWQFVVCPNATVPCTSTQLVVTGASMNVGTPISSVVPPIILGPLVALPRAYGDTEVTPITAGSSYFDTTLGISKVWNGVAWITFTSTTTSNTWLLGQYFKIEPWFDVTAWGAKCDNSTDDAAAFTAAINAASALGGTVNIPQGRICRSSATANFQATQGVTFKGGGAGSVALNGNMSRFIYTGTSSSAIAFGSSYGFQMQGIMVQYSNASFTGNVIDGLPPGCPGSCSGDTSHAFISNVIVDSLSGINTANVGLNLERTNTSHVQHMQFNHVKYGVQGFTALNPYSNGNTLGPILEFGPTIRTAMIENPGASTKILNPNFELTAGTNPLIAIDCSLASSGLGMTVDTPDFEDDTISVAHNLSTCGNTVTYLGGRWAGNVNATAIKVPASGYVTVIGGVLQTLGTFIDVTAGNGRVFIDGTQQDTTTVSTMLAGTPFAGKFCQFQSGSCDYYGAENFNGLITFKNVNTLFKSATDSEQDVDYVAGTTAEQQRCDRYFARNGVTLQYRVCVDSATNPTYKIYDGDGNVRLQFSYIAGSNAGTILSCQGTCGVTFTASGANVVWNGTTFTIPGLDNPTTLKVGTGATITKAEPLCSGVITPASVAATTCAEQTFTIAACSGLATTDTVLVNQSGGNVTLAFPVGDWRVSAAGILAHTYCNPTAGALTPTAQTLSVWRFR